MDCIGPWKGITPRFRMHVRIFIVLKGIDLQKDGVTQYSTHALLPTYAELAKTPTHENNSSTSIAGATQELSQSTSRKNMRKIHSDL